MFCKFLTVCYAGLQGGMRYCSYRQVIIADGDMRKV